MIGFHMQNSPPNWLDAVAKLPAGTPIKLVEGVQRAREVKATNPALKVWYRHVADNQNVGGDLQQYARIFFNTFIDTSFLNEAKYVDYVQELNEYTGHGQSPAERAFWEDWAAAAAHVWYNEYRTRAPLEHIRLIIGEPGIGNDLGLAFAQIADAYDCLIGYHSYIPVHNGQLMPLNAKHADGSEINEWKYYSGRWATMDDSYRQHGYYVNWLAGEGGPIRDANPWFGALDPLGGWKHPECCSGHIDCYITALRRFLDLATAWNKEHNNRFKGMTLFTSGAPGAGPSWELFDLRQPHMNTIADFVADYMADIPTPPDPPDPPDPPPPPDPPTNQLINGSFENGWIDLNITAQQPAGWDLLLAEYDQEVRGRPVTGKPECVHLHTTQLPADEQLGAKNALILDGEYTYKIFSHGATWRASLYQAIYDLKPGFYKVTVPVNVHFDGRPDNHDPEDTLITLYAGGAEPVQLYINKSNQRQWHNLTTRAFTDHDNRININIQSSVKWQHPTAVFIDNIIMQPAADPQYQGQPREQYNRTVLVAPAETSLTAWLAICEEAYADRRTVSFSYDDAGIGDLRQKNAILYDIADQEKQLFLSWYKDHYPGTAVTFRQAPGPTGPQPSFTYTHWPTNHQQITQPFGANPGYYAQFGWTGGHEGIDIRAPLNGSVYAPAAGTITKIENMTVNGTPSTYGWHIHLDHGNGYETILAHLNGPPASLPAIMPKTGDHVAAGQFIATSGNTGNTTGPHLHLSLKQANAQLHGFPPGYIDPTPFIQHLVGGVRQPAHRRAA